MRNLWIEEMALIVLRTSQGAAKELPRYAYSAEPARCRCRVAARSGWKDCIGVGAEGAEISRVAEARHHAWKLAFDRGCNDEGLREAVFLLTPLGVAGKS